MNPGTFLGGPDYVAAWIRVDRLVHPKKSMAAMP